MAAQQQWQRDNQAHTKAHDERDGGAVEGRREQPTAMTSATTPAHRRETSSIAINAPMPAASHAARVCRRHSNQPVSSGERPNEEAVGADQRGQFLRRRACCDRHRTESMDEIGHEHQPDRAGERAVRAPEKYGRCHGGGGEGDQYEPRPR